MSQQYLRSIRLCIVMFWLDEEKGQIDLLFLTISLLLPIFYRSMFTSFTNFIHKYLSFGRIDLVLQKLARKRGWGNYSKRGERGSLLDS
jgi:hypothetical protein